MERFIAAGLVWGILSPASPASAIEACPGGRCLTREGLELLAATDADKLGGGYDASIYRSMVGTSGGSVRRGAPTPGAGGLKQGNAAANLRAKPPAPSPKRDKGGIMGFLGRHKWDIAGGLLGGLAALFMGGLLGIVVGVAVGLAVKYLGPKLFGEKEKD